MDGGAALPEPNGSVIISTQGRICSHAPYAGTIDDGPPGLQWWVGDDVDALPFGIGPNGTVYTATEGPAWNTSKVIAISMNS